MSKKTLSSEQIEDAERLKAIFNEKKKEARQKGERISQETIADKMDMTQGAVGHFLNARSPLNLSNAIKFADVLGVSVADFSPSLAKQLTGKIAPKQIDSIAISEINDEANTPMDTLKKLLNSNESFLIEKFRSLSTENQHALITIISGIEDKTVTNNKTVN
ncbi:MAG: helix-turn-helix transcriptional regulator, partial [Moraxellaceae bacterium]|nr:helix-turn-helix transcriptional regulator [Moraxellaceae bacterium]